MDHPIDTESRRTFLKKTAAAAASLTGVTVATRLWAETGHDHATVLRIVTLPEDTIVKLPPVQWAIQQLQETLTSRGILVELRQGLDSISEECVLVASTQSPAAQQWLADAEITAPTTPESLVLARGKSVRQSVLLAGGTDARGLVYALLELADRARWSADPLAELRQVKRIVQQPANQIRSIARIFASEVEDKTWYYDRSFWQSYLTELALQRFNRFHLSLGLGYDQPIDLSDTYFYFAYPFLVSVPGYDVRATPLSDAERDRNLEMLKFISDEAALRGLHFQLGIWTHAYQWVNSPRANYVIDGLSHETHAAYCRDALTALLKTCPAIGGVTLRIHGESGVPEGSYDFWRTVFDGVTRCGRRVEIDMHAKGIDQKMIESALATGMPVNVSPKFWAEHMGLGYMQGAIRPLEMPPQDEQDNGFFSLSTGSRRFLRYGYGDLLAENRRYGVLHRVWPGTQRLLLWGSPEMAADYGRASNFCGSLGVEWFEPLSFKGRKGSGLPGGRNGYSDLSLRPDGPDFEKYLYSYRLWGRHIYDPDCDPEEWRRWLRKEFHRGAAAVETALSQASQILPLITTAHCPSAANNDYWPEVYTNMSIVDASHPGPYQDTVTPKCFGTVSPLDPEFFSRIDDFAAQLLSGEVSAKHSPIYVAETLEARAQNADRALAEARRKVDDRRGANFRRLAADVMIQNGIGRFFAWKIRAGVLFAVYESTKYRPALEEALKAYHQARSAWAAFAEGARDVYQNDLTFGPENFQRGHWLDRLLAIDKDIRKMEELLKSSADVSSTDHHVAKKAIAAVLHPPREPQRKATPDFHSPPKQFRRGEPVWIEAAPGKSSPELVSVRLHFRHVNQGETWRVVEMEASGVNYRVQIGADYANSPYPLQYYFELRDVKRGAWLWPGLPAAGRAQPYFVIRQA
ncbi:MAG TPA: hypothetical protein VG938_05290 [Verrucomicrobiae bacterium]|jgi:hypothetical protein|nr:hypothetical protein [Verrucomicrobiae bacterium]